MSEYENFKDIKVRTEILGSLQQNNWFWQDALNSGEKIVKTHGEEAVLKVIKDPAIWAIGFKKQPERWKKAYGIYCSDELAIEICAGYSDYLKYFQGAKNKAFVLSVLERAQKNNVKNDFLDHVSTDLRKDKEVVMAAVKKNGMNFFKSSRAGAIRNDMDIIKAAVASCPDIVGELPVEFKVMKELALIAVSNKGTALGELDFFQDDREVVMVALKNDGAALRYVSNRLRHDRAVSSEAVKSNSSAMANVPEHFCTDLSFCLQALESKKGNGFLQHCDIELRCDKSFVQLAIEHYPQNYAYASLALKMDRDIYEPLIKIDGAAYFKFLPYELRNNPEIVGIALEKAQQTFKKDESKDESKALRYQIECGTIFENAGTDVQKIIVEPRQIGDGIAAPTNFSLERAYDNAGDKVFKVETWRVVPDATERHEQATKKLETYLLTKKLTSDLSAKDGQEQSKPKRMKI